MESAPANSTVAALTPTRAPNAFPGKGLAELDFFYAGEAKEENMYIVKAVPSEAYTAQDAHLTAQGR